MSLLVKKRFDQRKQREKHALTSPTGRFTVSDSSVRVYSTIPFQKPCVKIVYDHQKKQIASIFHDFCLAKSIRARSDTHWFVKDGEEYLCLAPGWVGKHDADFALYNCTNDVLSYVRFHSNGTPSLCLIDTSSWLAAVLAQARDSIVLVVFDFSKIGNGDSRLIDEIAVIHDDYDRPIDSIILKTGQDFSVCDFGWYCDNGDNGDNNNNNNNDRKRHGIVVVRYAPYCIDGGTAIYVDGARKRNKYPQNSRFVLAQSKTMTFIVQDDRQYLIQSDIEYLHPVTMSLARFEQLYDVRSNVSIESLEKNDDNNVRVVDDSIDFTEIAMLRQPKFPLDGIEFYYATRAQTLRRERERLIRDCFCDFLFGLHSFCLPRYVIFEISSFLAEFDQMATLDKLSMIGTLQQIDAK